MPQARVRSMQPFLLNRLTRGSPLKAEMPNIGESGIDLKSLDNNELWPIPPQKVTLLGMSSTTERLAYWAYLAEEKTKFHPSELCDRLKTNDPDALALMTDDIQGFMRRVRDRIIRDHPNEVAFNWCPKCGGLAMTPKARQCRWCCHDWHDLET